MTSNSDKNLVPYSLVQFLLSLAFVGIEKGLFHEARSLLFTVVELYPNNLYAQTAKGIGELLMGHRNEGFKILQYCLLQDPKNEDIKGWLVFGLKYYQLHEEASKVSELLLKDCESEDCKVLAQWVNGTSYASPSSVLQQQQAKAL